MESDLPNIVGAVPASNRVGLVILRATLVSSVAVAFLAGLTSSSDAYFRGFGNSAFAGGWYGGYSSRRVRVTSHSHRERSEPKTDPGFGELPKGPLQNCRQHQHAESHALQQRSARRARAGLDRHARSSDADGCVQRD